MKIRILEIVCDQNQKEIMIGNISYTTSTASYSTLFSLESFGNGEIVKIKRCSICKIKVELEGMR